MYSLALIDKKNLGLAKGHEGSYYEQLIYDGKLILQLHNMDPDDNHDALLDLRKSSGKGIFIWLKIDAFNGAIERLKIN